MKTHTLKLLVALTILASLRQAVAQGTSFTYQGQLNANGAPTDGSYDLTFALYTNSSGGTATVGPITNLATEVSNGLFTTTIDFGADVFTGASNWLEIGARTNGSGAFTTLTPRQEITATPYALYAPDAGSAATATTAISAAMATNALGFSGSLAGDVTGAQSATVVSKVDGQTAANVASGVVAANAATSANTTSTIVKRDGSGNFLAGTITANLAGHAAVASNVLSGINITNAFLTNAVITNSAFGGNGGGLSNLNASQLTSIGNTDGGSENFFVGPAGNATTTGSQNTALGNNALAANTTGNGNTATGEDALAANTTGYANTANGTEALYGNMNGIFNTANGELALYSNTNGSFNTANGAEAIFNNKSGSNNTANGVFALYSNTNGSFNTANGEEALFSSKSGSGNTANGAEALFSNTSGSNNTADGMNALSYNGAGNNNTAVGYNALFQLGYLYSSEALASGTNNIALGYQAGYNFTGIESSNIDIGHPGVAGENNIIRIGSNQTAAYIAGVINGNGGGLTNLNASNLTGAAASVTLSNLTLNGALILPNVVSGGQDVIYSSFGVLQPIFYADFSGNFFSGFDAGNLESESLGGYNNTAVGSDTLGNIESGFQNTAIGVQALASVETGYNNTADGFRALMFSAGSNNTASGSQALSRNVDGNNNTAMGFNALGQLGLNNGEGGSSNIALGYLAGFAYNANESSNIDIGHPGVAGENNIIRIGSNQTAAYIAGVISGNGGGLTNLNASELAVGANRNFFAGGAGNSSSTGLGDNTAIGSVALASLTDGNLDSAYGTFALAGNTSGSFNTASGGQALEYNQTGNFNAAFGYGALYASLNGNNNTAMGADALGQLGLEALFYGQAALTGGSNNVALGTAAGYNYAGNESSNIDIGNSGTLGENYTIHIGDPAVHTNAFLAGVYGVKIANSSLPVFINASGQLGSNGAATFSAQTLTLSGSLELPAVDPVIYAGGGTFFFADTDGNTAGGLNTLLPNRGSGNVAFGQQTLEANVTGGYNTAVGFQALAANTAPFNAGFGSGALLVNTTGQDNTALGTSTLFNNKTGSDNTAAGFQALYGNTNGAANTAVGYDAGYSLKEGTNNIVLGYQAGYNLTGSSNIDIGNTGTAGENNIIRIGVPGVQTATYLAGTVYANGVSISSDRNVKENFTSVDRTKVLAKVIAMPVTEWNYKGDAADKKHIGPVAQDFQAAFGLNGDDNKHISVVDEGGVALAAIQGLNQKLEEQKTENAELKHEVAELKEMVQKLAGGK